MASVGGSIPTQVLPPQQSLCSRQLAGQLRRVLGVSMWPLGVPKQKVNCNMEEKQISVCLASEPVAVLWSGHGTLGVL